MPGRISSPFTLNLPDTPYTTDPKNYTDIATLYNAIQQLQQQMTDRLGIMTFPDDVKETLPLSSTVHPEYNNRIYLEASEDITAGMMVNFWNDAGTLKVRKANATDNTKPAHGYANAAFLSGGIEEAIVMNGLNSLIAGMTPGTIYYLSTVGGLITQTEPSTTGNLIQKVGIALAATSLYVMINLTTSVVP